MGTKIEQKINRWM